ncbi:LacI family DNA-binding transcriptional regulator [Clostridium lacusfryxellense]|uniref:LacI family DNA-binding transcriptional regulator n=1 Tax=Clostridium lacusfryxellense TaxID=205328 RepID=UPI001FE535C4|nr:LacI family DNA-binding transcriptional regulator [Clostridium lacusfryxellense]
MKDIAEKVGVSQSTVSRVINGSSSVAPEIKMKVMECVRILDYHPNVIAQSLVGNKTLLIGVIITDISNPFFSDIIKAVEAEASKYGYSIILCNTGWNAEKEKNYISILKSYKVDGILIVPSDVRGKYFRSLKNSEIPIVVITQDVPEFSCISISHYISGVEVAKHLINMGYSKFVFDGVEHDEKAKGFKQEIIDSGFNINTNLFFTNEEKYDSPTANLKEFISNNYKSERIGIFAFNDIEALKVLHLLKEMKVKVPENVGLVGFDNTFISKETSPTISSVAQPIEEIGRQAIEILVDKICKNNNMDQKHVVLEPRIVVRESSVKSTMY